MPTSKFPVVRTSLVACASAVLAVVCLDTDAIGQGSPKNSAPAANNAEDTGATGFVPTDKAVMFTKQRQFLEAHDHTRIENHDGDQRVYGKAFATGPTAVAAANNFKNNHIEMFGAQPADVVALSDFPHIAHGQHTIGLMHDPVTGQPKFNAVYYTQARGGIPVYDTRVIVLTRNEPNNPVVLVNPDVRPLGNFEVNPNAAQGPMPAAAVRSITQQLGRDIQFHSVERVIWAGLQGAEAEPRLADNSVLFVNGFDEWRTITDAVTGELLHHEHLICFGAPVNGTARGMATEGIGSEQCENEVPMVLPYMRVTSGANSTFTDANGNFTIDPDGGTINAVLDGQYFDVDSWNLPDTSASIPSSNNPADLLFNSLNVDPLVRAQVNLYVESNVVRDFVLQYNPTYPFVFNQTNFPARANRTDNFCPGNAWYSPTEQSINFCQAGPSNPNTAWSSVVHHEYGHRLVNAAGSGQGAYGEGSGDVMSVLILDSPYLGWGFFNSCAGSLRNADNTCNYVTSGCSTCGSAIHTCGQLLSGCVWQTRNRLAVTNPGNYIDILAPLAINAMLLHTGTAITPQITIDYLTLDDNDSNILNGTPHYNEINGGFTQHNMPGPALVLVDFEFPSGRPNYVNPNGTTTIEVDVVNVAGSPVASSGVLFADTGSGFQQYAMNETGPNQYEATIPVSDCGTIVRYYFRATAEGGVQQFSPSGAPASFYSATSAFSAVVAINDDFQADLGWTTAFNWTGTGTPTGHWTRAVPFAPSNTNTPAADADGSGMCYVTGNSSSNDVDQGSAVLTSPIMDASQNDMVLSYWRWYDTSATNTDTFDIHFSINGGASWNVLEIVQPVTVGSWIQRTYNLDSLPGFSPTSQFQLRFTAQDLGTQQVIEAAVDGVKVERLICGAFCQSDVDGNGTTDIDDLLAVINAWGSTGGPADVNGSGLVDIDDLLQVINGWGPCN